MWLGDQVKRNRKQVFWVFLFGGICILACVFQFSGGSDKEKEKNRQRLWREVRKENDMAVKSHITMAGSAAMEKFANMAAEGFMASSPGMTVTVEFTGSAAGIESVLAGRCEIGNASRDLREVEKEAGAVAHVVALDGIVVIVDTANQVSSLTTEQLADIYAGRIRNWKEVGGADLPTVTIGRENGSGTRSTFESLLGVRDLCHYANELDSAGAVAARVASTPGAVGYVSLAVAEDMTTIRTIALNGIRATKENVRAGTYPLWMPFAMVTKGRMQEQTEAVQAFFAYLDSEEGYRLIRSAGLIVPD